MTGPAGSFYAAVVNEAISRGDAVNSGAGEGGPGFCWAALVARVLHPVDVQIIEAFQWIDEPLSADDLSQLFEGSRSWASLCHHIRRLSKLDAIELAETPTTRNITKIRYRLARRRRDGR